MTEGGERGDSIGLDTSRCFTQQLFLPQFNKPAQICDWRLCDTVLDLGGGTLLPHPSQNQQS